MDKSRILDTLFKILCCIITLLGMIPIIHMLVTITLRGSKVIAKVGIVDFLTAPPPAPGSNELGGIGTAIMGTIILLIISMIIGIPLSLILAILVVEFKESLFAKITRYFVKTLIGIPTIAVSMLIYTLVVVPMGGASAIAGGIALAIVLLPYATTYIETCFESVPQEYKEAGYALGMKRLLIILKIILPITRRCVVTSIVLSTARAIGETSPLLFTAGAAHYTYPTSLTDPVSSVTLLIFEYGLSPFKNLVDVAWGAALVLTLSYFLVLIAVRLGVKGVVL